MAITLAQQSATPTGPPARPSGVLAIAAPAPDGWEQGGIATSTTCAQPQIVGNCVTFRSEAPSPQLAEFQPFIVEQGSGCSTISGEQRAAEATTALQSATDYALGYALMVGVGTTPSLTNAEEVDGGDIVATVAALEAAASENGGGQFYVLHASPSSAVYLASFGLIDGNGRSPSGAPWIISAGYENGEAQVWVTGQVWAAVGDIAVQESVDRRTNNREAWAVRSAIVGFNTCINYTATFVPTAGGGSEVDQEARNQIAALETIVNGKADASHTHNASDIDSGTLAAARVPTLAIGKVSGLQGALDGKGQVNAVSAGSGIAVDSTDPANPVISADI